MEIRVFAILISFTPVVLCANHTITHEASFDIEVRDFDGPGDDLRGRIVIGLFGDTVPMTVLNFVSITNGYKTGKKKLHYKGTVFHRIVTDFVIQGGDNSGSEEEGSGGEPIFGATFVDENFSLSHEAAGYVSMANQGPDTNGSQFFILLTKARWLDKKHVVFGKVISGMDLVKTIGEIKSDEQGRPKKRVKIIDCEADEVKKFTLTEEERSSDKDLDR